VLDPGSVRGLFGPAAPLVNRILIRLAILTGQALAILAGLSLAEVLVILLVVAIVVLVILWLLGVFDSKPKPKPAPAPAPAPAPGPKPAPTPVPVPQPVPKPEPEPDECLITCSPGTSDSYGDLDARGRPTIAGALIRVRPSPGEPPHVDPPGFHPDAGDHRGHMLAKSLGGKGHERNIVTLHKSANFAMYHQLESLAKAHIVTTPTHCFSYDVRADYDGSAEAPFQLVVNMVDLCTNETIINQQPVTNRLLN
jgi:hypothetical protein